MRIRGQREHWEQKIQCIFSAAGVQSRGPGLEASVRGGRGRRGRLKYPDGSLNGVKGSRH